MKSISFLSILFCLLAPSLFVKQPNIVLIMADDFGYGDAGCYGQQLLKTPNIDRLAAEGIRFTQAYAGGPVCTSSRCVLMTGLHNGHTAARDNVPHYHTYLTDEDVTVAEILQEADYQTGGVGKWSLGDAGTEGRATNQGFDTWFGYLNQDHAHYYFTEYLDDDEGRLELSGNSESREHYSHDLLTDRALQFIREQKEAPFFLYVAYTIPHFSAADEDADRFAVPTFESYADRDWSDQSKKYAAMVDFLDRDVGRIVEQIDKLGLGEDTLVIFTSDNGGHKVNDEQFRTSGPLRGFKRDLTEGGIRVPFIARWPETIPAAAESTEVIAFQDLLPTFAELANAEIPENVDGISVVEALVGKPLSARRPFLYWDYGHNRARYDQAVRIGNWKGLRLGKDGTIQLFDLSTDLGESDDLAAKHPGIVAKIEEIMGSAFVENQRYTIGQRYRGQPIWKRE
ncbi:MAG: arylsulfatase [Verrucomicrobiota bacterium]